MRKTLVCISLLVLLGSLGKASAQDQVPVIAVFAIEDSTAILTAEEAKSLTTYLGTRLAEEGRFRLIPENDLRRVLQEQKKASYKACFDQHCQIEIGRELAAQLSLSTRISRVGSNCLLTATIYDLGTAASQRTATARGGCQVSQVLKSIESLVVTLRGDKKIATPSTQPAPPPKPVVLPPTNDAPPPRKRPSGLMVLMRDAGIITLYTFGGLGSAAGVALIGVGLGVDDMDYLYGGIPALIGGVGLILLAYWITPDDDVASGPGESSSTFAVVPGLGGLSIIGRF